MIGLLTARKRVCPLASAGAFIGNRADSNQPRQNFHLENIWLLGVPLVQTKSLLCCRPCEAEAPASPNFHVALQGSTAP